MGQKDLARIVSGPNDPVFPYIQHPVGDGHLAHHPADCNLRRPGHVVRPINTWHRCYPRLVTVLPLPISKPSRNPFKQRFLLIERDQETREALPVSHRFVVHNPEELRAYLRAVGGDVRYSPGHSSLWGKGLSCNVGFSPCFSKPYPCSEELGEGWTDQYGRVAYREDSQYKDGDDCDGGPDF